MPEVKPIRWSFLLSLPLVVAAMWTAFVALARVERNQLVATLSERAAHGGDREATLAIRQLARMSRPPLDVLVDVAATPNPPVAHEARLAIDDLLRKWQRQVKSGSRVSQVTQQLGSLAELLDSRREAFTPYDHAWLRRTAERIIQLANRASPGPNAALALHCDSLLSLTTQESVIASASSSMPALTVVATRPLRSELQPTKESLDQNPAQRPASASHLPDGAFAPLPSSALDALIASDAARTSGVSDSRGAAPSDWRPHWSPPLVSLSTAGTQPLTFRRRTAPMPVAARTPATVQPHTASSDSPNRFAAEDTRSLMRQWTGAEGSPALEIERELTRRGFRQLSPRLVELLLSADAADRERLVFDVMSAPGIDAKAWLALLAEDSDPRVRFAAVSMMATSNDPALVDKALDVALHDQDPRVASLAERLRQRRSAADRR